jgi:hypothetical protein
MANNTNFPQSLDSPVSSRASVRIPHTLHVTSATNFLHDAVLALERKVGVNGSSDTSSLDYLVSTLSENVGLTHAQVMARISLRF